MSENSTVKFIIYDRQSLSNKLLQLGAELLESNNEYSTWLYGKATVHLSKYNLKMYGENEKDLKSVATALELEWEKRIFQ